MIFDPDRIADALVVIPDKIRKTERFGTRDYLRVERIGGDEPGAVRTLPELLMENAEYRRLAKAADAAGEPYRFNSFEMLHAIDAEGRKVAGIRDSFLTQADLKRVEAAVSFKETAAMKTIEHSPDPKPVVEDAFGQTISRSRRRGGQGPAVSDNGGDPRPSPSQIQKGGRGAGGTAGAPEAHPRHQQLRRGRRMTDTIAPPDAVLEKSFDPHDLYKTVVERLPSADRQMMQRLSVAKGHYVMSGRDRYFGEKFDVFLRDVLTMKGDVRDEGRIFTLTGPSGAGKTQLVRHILAGCQPLQPIATEYGEVNPIISVRLSGKCTLGALGYRILQAAGYPMRRAIEPARLWLEMSDLMAARGVLLIHLDETQHLVHLTEKDRDRKDLSKALKDVVNHETWPVSFVLTGLPHTSENRPSRPADGASRVFRGNPAD